MLRLVALVALVAGAAGCDRGGPVTIAAVSQSAPAMTRYPHPAQVAAKYDPKTDTTTYEAFYLPLLDPRPPHDRSGISAGVTVTARGFDPSRWECSEVTLVLLDSEHSLRERIRSVTYGGHTIAPLAEFRGRDIQLALNAADFVHLATTRPQSIKLNGRELKLSPELAAMFADFASRMQP